MEKTNRENSKYLTSLLHTRANEYKMLSNTLCEIMERNPSPKAIHMFKDEMDVVLNDICNIKKSLVCFDTKEDDNEYGYYNEEDKSWFEKNEKKSIYDSIEKAEEKNEKCVGSCCSCIKKVADKAMKEHLDDTDLDRMDLSKDILDEFRKSVDARIPSNRFLVDFKDSLGIPEFMVNSVNFESYRNGLYIIVYDFVASIDGKSVPMLELLKNAPKTFDITIKHLEGDGNLIYNEKYSGCSIEEINRDKLDYSNDEFSKFSLFITYRDVRYEASDQE